MDEVAPKPKRLRNAARREHDALVAKQKADAQAAYDALPGCKKRKKSPPLQKKTGRKNPAAAEISRAAWADPVKRASMLLDRKLHPEKYYRRGVPDGMRKPEAMKIWAEARVKAKQAIVALEDKGALPVIPIPDSDEEKAKIVLEEMMVITLSPISNAQSKIAAGRTVLEWTRSKPVLKTAVAISNAEEWLNSVILDHKASDATRSIEGTTN